MPDSEDNRVGRGYMRHKRKLDRQREKMVVLLPRELFLGVMRHGTAVSLREGLFNKERL